MSDCRPAPRCLTVTQHLVGLVLQHPQKFHLAGQRQFANLVEEDGAALGQFKTADAVGLGISKRAFLVAEHLALEQRRGDTAEVHLHKRPVSPLALSVNSLCDEFLARTALTCNQDGRIGRSNAGHGSENAREGGADNG